MSTALRHLQTLIRDQALPAGAPLPSEVQLSRELGISRGSVREAYRALAATGAVEVGNGRVPRVGGLNAAPVTSMLEHVLDTRQVTPQHVLQLRRAIEIQAASLAAMHRSAAQAAALEGTVTGMERSGPGGDAFVTHDLAFHETLAQASGNPLFAVLNRALHRVFESSIRRGQHHYADPYHFGALVEAHRKVAAAVRNQDAPGAAAAMREHFAQAELVAMLLELDSGETGEEGGAGPR
ncbi:hypothetical protein DEIPH_ctg047orf0002 [Deinococcus phoenicis]|uniref:HTH gntR-type domain-containing protein n=1 Tax=Deinococcus phoenicis TaxID=1476583 RepID=A0A016QMI2_9DEIO|nr:hypothetical protein DEIPH_ctg047orf0002 [Deinococcus phoenicis]